jgi:hypothetical protein
VRLIHTTRIPVLSDILSRGIRRDKARSKAKRCWLHRRALKSWARKHVSDRHHVDLSAVVCIEVEVPESWLFRFSAGVFYVERDIPPAMLIGVEFLPSQWGGKLK